MATNTFQMNVDLSLTVKTCPTCFVVYAAPAELFKRKNSEGGSWFCPNGHSLVFTKSELEQTKEKLAKAVSDSNYWKERKNEIENQKQILERRFIAKKAEITKLKNRVANGVCPCCNRSFSNLQRHISSQHPGFNKETE